MKPALIRQSLLLVAAALDLAVAARAADPVPAAGATGLLGQTYAALTVGLDRDNHQNTGFTVGTNFRS